MPATNMFWHQLLEEKKYIADTVHIPGLKAEDGICLLVGADQMWKFLLNEVFPDEQQQGLVAINTKLG